MVEWKCIGGIRIMAVHDLPKVRAPVRFRYPAPSDEFQIGGLPVLSQRLTTLRVGFRYLAQRRTFF